MRKWVVPGLLLVVIGLVVFLFSQPSNGTVAYHKNQYLKAKNALASPGWLEGKLVPNFVRDFYWKRNAGKLTIHQNALIDAGYLQNTSFVASNASANDVLKAALKSLDASGFDRRLTVLWAQDTHTITGIVPVHAMESVLQALRKADVPKAQLLESE